MNRKTQILIISLVAVVGLLGSEPRSGQTGSQPSYTMVSLTPAWTTGIVSDGVGPAKIVVANLDQDTKTDIATCSNGYAYALNDMGSDKYDTTWYSEYLACQKLASADRDGNGVRELYVATADGRVMIYGGDNYQRLGDFSLPSGSVANDIEVADVDGDGAPEIVLACADATLVYDATTFHLEWQATGLGGSQVAIGNIDNDSLPEIVVNSNPAHILNAAQKIQEWAYSGGFGISLGVGDVDGDNRAEIAYIADWDNAYVFDGDTLTIKWQRNDLGDLNIVAVADVNGDNIGEVLIGNGQWGSITAYQGNNGTQLWSIPNPEHGVFGIGVGDANNDHVNEVVWGAGLSSSGKDALFVGSWISQTVQWSSDDLDGPLYVAARDVDNDGQGEIVMATRSTTSGYVGGTIRVYDGATHQLEWSTVVYGSFFNVSQLAIGQLDSDVALEILVGGDNWYNTRLQAYDGISRTVDWQSPALGSGAPRALLTANLDADAVDEIVIGLNDQHVQVLNGATAVIQWDSGSLDGAIQDLAIGDLDGNATIDLAVLTSQSVYVFEVGTWAQKLHQGLADGRQLAIANSDLNGAGELLLVTSAGSTNNMLQAWEGTTHAVLWQRPLGDGVVNDLAVADLDVDGSQEIMAMGNPGSSSIGSSLLWIGSPSYFLFWEHQLKGQWGSINSVALSDVDNDGQTELLLGSSALIQVNEMTTSSVTIQNAYLPLITKPQPWVKLLEETFEGAFPGPWQLSDNYPGTGEYYWAKRNCRAYAGSYSGWAVGGGAQGNSLSCGSLYPNDAESWMVYGPFNLADAAVSDLNFKLWLNSELNYDGVCRMASTNGVNFYGTCTSGDTAGWTDRVLDLSNVSGLGNLLGQPNVWVAIVFSSDVDINYAEGGYVDNIVLRKCITTNCPALSAVTRTSDNQTIDFSARKIWPR